MASRDPVEELARLARDRGAEPAQVASLVDQITGGQTRFEPVLPRQRPRVGQRGQDLHERAAATLFGDAPSDAPTVAWEDGDPSPAPLDRPPEPLPDAGQRYTDCGPLGQGGMAEVRRVYDHLLRRTVAMKALLPKLADDPALRARFLREARLTAQLQHPAIPPVHDIGELPDGRPYFTLKEVRGDTLASAIAAFDQTGGVLAQDGPATLRRLVEALRLAGAALACAHERGVVHRDLKPTNIMLGAHGEVLVMDWGIARAGGEVDLQRVAWDEVPETAPDATGFGMVMGTRGFMAPEQERGAVGPAGDVYALGRILERLLLAAAAPPGVDAPVGGRGALDGLWDLVQRATDPRPDARPNDASALTRELVEWLDGTERRERALAAVAQAEALGPEISALLAEQGRLAGLAEQALRGQSPAAPVAERVAAWRNEDAAVRVGREARRLALRRELLLQGALARADDLEEAHRNLAALLRERHGRAEAAGEHEVADESEVRLREHALALPVGSAERQSHLEWLDGGGALTLLTDPPGAAVDLFRVEEHDRRRVEVLVRRIGPTPIVAMPLARGSYLLLLRSPGRVDVRYPVCLDRLEHWEGTPPGGTAAQPVYLPPLGSIGADERYVPAGWHRCGGDRVVIDAVGARRAWVDGFACRVHPQTNRDHILFLDALHAAGDEELALSCAPRTRAAQQGGVDSLLYGRRADGGFELVADCDGDVWDPDWPVIMVDQRSAWAHAEWLRGLDGRQWRLPSEWEREKAARGVDGRLYPWGDHFDPGWACERASRPGVHGPARVQDFPDDLSPYGVRGLAGNVRDWCADPFVADPPPFPRGRAPRPPSAALPAGTWVACRGGYWNGSERSARSTSRYQQLVELRNETVGMRFVRDVLPP